MFNFLKFVPQILALALAAVQGVEALHKEKDSTTKQQMAHDAVLLSSGVAAAIDPKDTQTIKAVSQSTNEVIDSVVSAFHAAGIFTKKSPAPSA